MEAAARIEAPAAACIPASAPSPVTATAPEATASETSSWTLSRLLASISGPTFDSGSVPRAVVISFIFAANFSADVTGRRGDI